MHFSQTFRFGKKKCNDKKGGKRKGMREIPLEPNTFPFCFNLYLNLNQSYLEIRFDFDRNSNRKIYRIYFYLNSDININYFKVVSISIQNQIKDYSKAISISMKFY